MEQLETKSVSIHSILCPVNFNFIHSTPLQSMKKEIMRQNQVEGLSTSSSSRIMEEVDANLVSTSVGKEDEEERHQSAECDEELSSKSGCSSSLGQKTRRLSVIQVKALVKDFETENKLDPERKVRLAQELGLRPNQIAIWFQNRRARSKTKQLESDYDALKARHGALKLGVDSLRADREALIAKLKELKGKLADFAVATTMEEAKIAGEGGREEATGYLKDIGTRDIDSGTVFGEEASPNYSSVLMGPQHCLLGTKSHWSAFLFDQHHGLLLQEGAKYLEEGFSSGEEVCANLSSDEHATDEILECAPRVWE